MQGAATLGKFIYMRMAMATLLIFVSGYACRNLPAEPIA